MEKKGRKKEEKRDGFICIYMEKEEGYIYIDILYLYTYCLLFIYSYQKAYSSYTTC
jgi:hypothetical protein